MINTHEKLVRWLLEGTCDDVDASLHPWTMQRILHSYMEDKGLRLSFATNDHNACPNWKDISHAILLFHDEGKMILKHLVESHAQQSSDAVSLIRGLEITRFQEFETTAELQAHRKRHLNIRKLLSHLITYFKVMRSLNIFSYIYITRWRFDAGAHCCTITEDPVVFSHEQWDGPKNYFRPFTFLAVEKYWEQSFLSEHRMSTAAYGRPRTSWYCFNWILWQKSWQANSLGNYSAEDWEVPLLEYRPARGVRKIYEAERRFAVQPLPSIYFAAVFRSLGYAEMSPCSFSFSRRNIHFSAATRTGVKETLDVNLLKIFGDLLPDNEGISPLGRSNSELMFDQRYIGIPAAKV